MAPLTFAPRQPAYLPTGSSPARAAKTESDLVVAGGCSAPILVGELSASVCDNVANEQTDERLALPAELLVAASAQSAFE